MFELLTTHSSCAKSFSLSSNSRANDALVRLFGHIHMLYQAPPGPAPRSRLHTTVDTLGFSRLSCRWRSWQQIRQEAIPHTRRGATTATAPPPTVYSTRTVTDHTCRPWLSLLQDHRSPFTVRCLCGAARATTHTLDKVRKSNQKTLLVGRRHRVHAASPLRCW